MRGEGELAGITGARFMGRLLVIHSFMAYQEKDTSECIVCYNLLLLTVYRARDCVAGRLESPARIWNLRYCCFVHHARLAQTQA